MTAYPSGNDLAKGPKHKGKPMVAHRFRWLMAICCAVQFAALPAYGAPPTPANAGEARVAVKLPFDPPVETPLRYAFERRVETGGQVHIMRSVEELRFRRLADGWQLQWITRSVDLLPSDTMPPLPAAVAKANVGLTLLLSLDAAGVMRGIDNLDAVRAASNRALTAMLSEMDTQFAAMPAGRRQQLRQMMNGLADQRQRQTDGQFVQGLFQFKGMLLLDGAVLVPDQPKQQFYQLPAPFGSGTLKYEARTVLKDWRPGIAARLVTTSVTDPDDFRRFMQVLATQGLANNPDARKRAAAEAATAAMSTPRIEDEMVQDIALPTGIVERVQYSRMVDIPGLLSSNETRKFTPVK